MNRLKIFFVILSSISIIFLHSCKSNTIEQKIPEDNISEQNEGGYKPVICYDKQLYWLDVNKPPKNIPENFTKIGTTNYTSESLEAYRLPINDLETNFASIEQVFVNPNDKSCIYTINSNGIITKYVLENNDS